MVESWTNETNGFDLHRDAIRFTLPNPLYPVIPSGPSSDLDRITGLNKMEASPQNPLYPVILSGPSSDLDRLTGLNRMEASP
ncbi:MAG: hypothetical protein U1E27_06955, partial [Kiritimatiellia bacterium]|nr:hypothetical protein [Kiritimatiellia bacterium]